MNIDFQRNAFDCKELFIFDGFDWSILFSDSGVNVATFFRIKFLFPKKVETYFFDRHLRDKLVVVDCIPNKNLFYQFPVLVRFQLYGKKQQYFNLSFSETTIKESNYKRQST